MRGSRGIESSKKKYIPLDWTGADNIAKRFTSTPEFYKALKAYKNNRTAIIYPFNSYTTNIDTAVVNAWAAGKTLFPEGFTDIDIEKKAGHIYEFFLGKSVYEKMKKEYGKLGRKPPFSN